MSANPTNFDIGTEGPLFGPHPQSADEAQAVSARRLFASERRRAFFDRRRSTHDRRAGDARSRRSSYAVPEAEAGGTAEDLERKLIVFQESERRRIAADLHDSIGSTLALVKLRLEDAISQSQSGAPGSLALASIAQVASQMNAAIEDVHRIAMNLRPSILDDLGIIATLCWLAREIKACNKNLDVQHQISALEAEVPNSLKTPIFRIAQEASSNALKHSGCGLLRITLRRESDTLRLMVEDDGRGFDASNVLYDGPSARNFGLAGMRQRAKWSGASFAITSAPEAGTTITASWRTTAPR